MTTDSDNDSRLRPLSLSGEIGRTSIPARIYGVYTPNMVPLRSDGRINEDELRRYIDWLIAKGVHGLYPNGSTGEFPRFTPEERRQISQIVCDQTKGRVPVLAGAAEANVRETLLACEQYLEWGARAVAIVAPFYYKLSPESVRAYFEEIARNTPIDVMLYNIPAYASPIDVVTVRELATLPRVIGIKDSSGDVAHMLRMMAAVEPIRADFVFFTGWEPVMVPMLSMGCQGGAFALSGVMPEVTRTIYELATIGRWAEARALQMHLTELFDRLVIDMDFPDGVRQAIEVQGFKLGLSRQPRDHSHNLDQRQIERMIEHLRCEIATPCAQQSEPNM